jgi:pimeloyl-ACP methyl ester carboxylesterase
VERAAIDDVELEYQLHGNGEPVLLIAPAAFSDGLARPLLGQTELARKYQLIHYRRRGYVGSTRGREALTIARKAQDAAGLLRKLGVARAPVAGHSYGGCHCASTCRPCTRPGAFACLTRAGLAQWSGRRGPSLADGGPCTREVPRRRQGEVRPVFQRADVRLWLGVSCRTYRSWSDRAGSCRRRHLLRSAARTD